jgi:tripartite-type tricarboxylate transporter receptor subunit TctC
VGRITQSDVVMVVSPESGIHSAQELLERAKKSPGKLTYASGGVGTPAHMGAELILASAGAKALHVPFKGATESANAVMAKQVDFALTLSSVSLPFIEAGKLVPLAVTAPKRNPRLPNVPTLAEAGIPNVSLVSFGGLSVPAGTPAPIVKKIGDALEQALAEPEVHKRLEANGALVAPAMGAEYAKDLQAEIALTEKMMRVAGIAAQ